MKRFALLASAALLIGCTQSATDTASGPDTGNAVTSDPAAEVSSEPVAVSFQPGDSATLEVPEMHCPFGCFPKVKDALEGVEGIAAIELVEQKEDGVIDDRRVVVTFDGAVDSTSAIAALDEVDMQGASFE